MVNHPDNKTQSNRANAQLSTGPKTPEGKAVSSLNGTTHGLAANRISPKNSGAIATLKRRIDAYTRHYNPTGSDDNPILADLIEDLAHARVRKDLIEDRLAELADDTAHEYQLMHRYLREAINSYHRSLRAIESIRAQNARQTDRDKRTQLAAKHLQMKLLKEEQYYFHPDMKASLASLRQEVRDLSKDSPVGHEKQDETQ